MSEQMLFPMQTYRALHSLFIDCVLQSHGDVREWLFSLTQGSMDFQHVTLAMHRGEYLQARYVVTDDDSRGWLLLYGLHHNGEWLRISGMEFDEAGLTIDYIRYSERIMVDEALDTLLAGES